MGGFVWSGSRRKHAGSFGFPMIASGNFSPFAAVHTMIVILVLSFISFVPAYSFFQFVSTYREFGSL